MNSNSPSINITLNPILEAYCRWIFEADSKGPIKINRKHEIGQHIFANVLPGDKSVSRPRQNNQVTFILPLTEISKDYLRSNFLKVDAWAEERIRDFINSNFRAWIRARFELGYSKRLDQKLIIEAILRGLNLRNNSDNFDMIKKIDYRNRRRKEEIRFEALLKNSL